MYIVEWCTELSTGLVREHFGLCYHCLVLHIACADEEQTVRRAILRWSNVEAKPKVTHQTQDENN